MELNKFQELSKRTMPFEGVPKNHIHLEHGLSNYALGLIGECVEVLSAANDREAVLKEMGDVSHYAFGILTFLGETYEPFANYSVEGTQGELIVDIVILSGVVSEEVKKFVFH